MHRNETTVKKKVVEAAVAPKAPTQQSPTITNLLRQLAPRLVPNWIFWIEIQLSHPHVRKVVRP